MLDGVRVGVGSGQKNYYGLLRIYKEAYPTVVFFGLDSPCRLFLIFYVAYHTGIVFDYYKVETVIDSFLLHNGIGYIWI